MYIARNQTPAHTHGNKGKWIMELPLTWSYDGRGYDGQQKDAICDGGGPCQAIQSKCIQASFSLISTDWLWIQVAQTTRCRDLANFVVMTDRPITLPQCMHTW